MLTVPLSPVVGCGGQLGIWQMICSAPLIVTVPLPGAADPDCSAPLMVTDPPAVVAVAPGFGSRTLASLPKASEQDWRFLPDSSVAVVQVRGAPDVSPGVSSYFTVVKLPSCLVVLSVRFSASYVVCVTPYVGSLVRP